MTMFPINNLGSCMTMFPINNLDHHVIYLVYLLLTRTNQVAHNACMLFTINSMHCIYLWQTNHIHVYSVSLLIRSKILLFI